MFVDTILLQFFIYLFIKFYYLFADGDLGPYNKVSDGYMKQKHRMVWERRHGPVGTGMKNTDSIEWSDSAIV